MAESSLHEDITPSLFRRMLATDDGAAEQLFRLAGVPVLFGVAGLAIGPAAAIAAGLYFLLWQRSPTMGRLLDWPWIVAGSCALVAGIAAQMVLKPGPGAWFEPWPPALHVYLPVFVPTWLWIQLTLGLFLTGWLVWANGWAAAPKGAAPKPERDKHGEFIKTPDRDKVRLDPYDGEAPAARTNGERPKALPKLTFTALATDEPDDVEPTFDDELPVFADEDAGLDDDQSIAR